MTALLASCSMTQKGKLYNLKSGQVTPVSYSYNGTGRGMISFVVNGKEVAGEYVTLANATTWGGIYGQYGGMAANSTQKGSAIAADGQGFVIECEYVTDVFSGGGTGYCRDSAGVDYRLSF